MNNFFQTKRTISRKKKAELRHLKSIKQSSRKKAKERNQRFMESIRKPEFEKQFEFDATLDKDSPFSKTKIQNISAVQRKKLITQVKDSLSANIQVAPEDDADEAQPLLMEKLSRKLLKSMNYKPPSTDPIEDLIRKKKKQEKSIKRSNQLAQEPGITRIDTEQFQDASDKFSNYMAENVVLLLQPFFVWMCWAFYHELNVGSGWGIKDKHFIYYFLFVIMYLFFQLCMDTVYFHVEYYYHGRDINKVLHIWKQNFEKRDVLWLGSLKEDLGLSCEKRLCYKFHFSSQGYFVKGISVGSLVSIILGRP